MRGRIDATPTAVTRWTARFAGQRIDVAVDACTGWLFVCSALVAAGVVPHLAEPVETRAARTQAAHQDRSRGRAVAARTARRRAVAGGVDPARARSAMALTGAAAAHADRRANSVDAAHPSHALPLLTPRTHATRSTSRASQAPPSRTATRRRASTATSRIDCPRTNAPITTAFSGSVRTSLVPLGNSVEANVSAASRTCGISFSSFPPRSAACAGESRCADRRRSCAARADSPGRRSYRARPSQASNSSSTARWMIQPGAQPGELRQRLPRVLTYPHGKQPLNLSLDLRRPRYVRLTAWNVLQSS
jgi:hypothetical protein